MVGQLDAPFFYVPGNHDVAPENAKITDAPFNIYSARHGVLGKTYYSFNYKNCHFLVLNTATAADDNNNNTFCQEQLAFIQKDLAGAKNAEHTFVFAHYPLWNDTKTWPTLSQLLPKGKSTIFNGHWHRLEYNQTNDIPAYVLPSTAAKTYGKPSEEHLYAQVVVHGGQPTISLIPPGQIKSANYARTMTAK